jgi:hypothetical protein
VTFPQSQKPDSKIAVAEHFGFRLNKEEELYPYGTSGENINIKRILSRYKWEKTENETRAEFNRRLKKYGIKTGLWKKTPLQNGN